MKFSGRTVLVVGASSALGEVIAASFAEADASLLLLAGKDEGRLASVQCSIAKARVCSIGCDCATDDCVQKLTSFIEENAAGKVDIVIGIPEGKSDKMELVMESDFMSMVRVANTVARFLTENGSVIFVTGPEGQEGTAQACAKAALTMFVKCCALDFGERKVRVNAVSPDMNTSETHATPLKRTVSLSGVANTVIFLASDMAMDMTGTETVVDCGACLLHGNA